MRVFFVNAVCGTGSTGRIVTDLCRELKSRGHAVRVAYAHGSASGIAPEDTVKIAGKLDYYGHNALSRMTDRAGFYSRIPTGRLIAEIRNFRPDLIHLHNLHGYYVNIRDLFLFLKQEKIPVVWTLHDCWALTGRCSHFSYVNCDRWKQGCGGCAHPEIYPMSWGKDQSARNYREKKQLFTGLSSLQVVTPSRWLSQIVSQSFLGGYPVTVIPNGIDLSVFQPTPGELREKYGIGEKYLVLAAANQWNERKGLSDVLYLAENLDPERYQVAIVGVTEKQCRNLPRQLLPILRTSGGQEMAKLYTAADLFINPTYEDTYPTVNLEALACGTPVITYKTGGSPEILDPSCGMVIAQGDRQQLLHAAEQVCETRPYSEAACRERVKNSGKESFCQSYLSLYEAMTKK